MTEAVENTEERGTIEIGGPEAAPVNETAESMLQDIIARLIANQGLLSCHQRRP